MLLLDSDGLFALSDTENETYGAFTLHGTGTGTGNRTGTIGDNGCGPIPGPGAM